MTLFVPLLFEVVAIEWHVELGGVTKKKKEALEFSLENFRRGEFQNRFEKWFTRKLDIRPALIKTDNQINYELFSQLSSSERGKAILGNDGHLIEKIYIKRAQGAFTPKRQKLLSKVKELKKTQRILQQYNIPLLILISTNKPSFYNEVIPNNYRVPQRLVGDYSPLQFFTEQLNNAGIPFIDSREFLKSEASSFNDKFFAQTGTHWNELGSCLITSKLYSTMHELLLGFDAKLECQVRGQRKLPLPMDRDLLSVTNLWTPEKLVHPAPLVKRAFQEPSHAPRPSVLFVGTSYLWALFYNIDKANAFSKRDMYYYFKRSVPSPRGTERPIDRSDPIWVKRALTHNLVVLEVNEVFLHRIGYGFPKMLLKYDKE
ncbi:MAG: hypothetical protein KDD70_04505 [Bdellovibrionales bacterium]|nr:hypothetical protein [Bdellovibrionales bacterium]